MQNVSIKQETNFYDKNTWQGKRLTKKVENFEKVDGVDGNRGGDKHFQLEAAEAGTNFQFETDVVIVGH